MPFKGNNEACIKSKPADTLPDTREKIINSSDKTTHSMRLLRIVQRYHPLVNTADMNKFTSPDTGTVAAA